MFYPVRDDGSDVMGHPTKKGRNLITQTTGTMDMWPVLPGPVDQPPGGKDEDGPCAPRLASGRGWGVPSIKEKGESVRVGGNRPSSGRRRSFLRPGPFFFV